ncbi:NADH dehydrogenase [ubiquinone] 1 beta subcomplex subunit 10 [Orchesella cincta]|uniref:NADH dehydrogenase [ubiquinone] 1 beta subcomplex subunit 10 n=1 Tax=Orchesella cincta TaxID=48709 RepID=A0A1D2MF86_ORCCI|nr:NADH dehydrogenase [ubiquinone] 1 beta subcomplex subunit 10 [Orchesella cincta]
MADNGEIAPQSSAGVFDDRLVNWFSRRAEWIRKTVVEPNQKKYPWYHRQFRRVPTIDQCYTDDWACRYEADQQYKRDRAVDSEIISILRYRMDDCVREEYPDHQRCFALKDAYEEAATNWFIKYGDLGGIHSVIDSYMKQKHRMLWERRHGPVGTGMKKNEFAAEADDH